MEKSAKGWKKFQNVVKNQQNLKNCLLSRKEVGEKCKKLRKKRQKVVKIIIKLKKLLSKWKKSAKRAKIRNKIVRNLKIH